MGISWLEAKDVAKCSIIHRMAPENSIIQPNISNMPLLRKAALSRKPSKFHIHVLCETCRRMLNVYDSLNFETIQMSNHCRIYQ